MSAVFMSFFLFLHIIFSPFHSFTFVSLPYQRANRYAVVGAKPVLVSFRLYIGYINRYAVVSVIPVFVILRLCIGYTNHYAVVGTTPLICVYTVMGCLLL